MLDNTEIVTTVQAIDLEPHTDDIDEWVSFTDTVSKGFDEAKRRGIGYIYKQAKFNLKGKFSDYCRAINVSESTVNREIQFYNACEEVDMPEEITAKKYEAIKGITPQDKLESFKEVQIATSKANPTIREIQGHKDTNIVYVITDGEYVKFGVTGRQLRDRLREIQNGNARQLVVLATTKMDNPYKLEATIFNMYKDSHILNEWYKLDFSLLGSDMVDIGMSISEHIKLPIKCIYDTELEYFRACEKRLNATLTH